MALLAYSDRSYLTSDIRKACTRAADADVGGAGNVVRHTRARRGLRGKRIYLLPGYLLLGLLATIYDLS